MRSQQSPMDQQHPAGSIQALADPMMTNYEPFDASTAFVSYTTVSHQQTLVSQVFGLAKFLRDLNSYLNLQFNKFKQSDRPIID